MLNTQIHVLNVFIKLWCITQYIVQFGEAAEDGEEYSIVEVSSIHYHMQPFNVIKIILKKTYVVLVFKSNRTLTNIHIML